MGLWLKPQSRDVWTRIDGRVKNEHDSLGRKRPVILKYTLTEKEYFGARREHAEHLGRRSFFFRMMLPIALGAALAGTYATLFAGNLELGLGLWVAAACLLIALPQPCLQDIRRRSMESLILAHSLTRIHWYRVTQPCARRYTRSQQHFQRKKKKKAKKQKRRKKAKKIGE